MSPLVKVRGIHHTAYTTSDLEASLTFWCDVLGFEVEGRFAPEGEAFTHVNGIPDSAARVALLRLPGTTSRVELFEYARPADRVVDRPPRPCDLGAHHIALHVEDLAAAVTACEAHGWKQLGRGPITPDDGPFEAITLLYLRDGRGGFIELVSGPGCER